MKQPPSKHHDFAFARDLFGNAAIIFRTRHHYDYIYGLFKGKEARGGHLESIESWHVEGEKLCLEGHPTKGNIVLVMGIPDCKEITGPEADALCAAEKAKEATK